MHRIEVKVYRYNILMLARSILAVAYIFLRPQTNADASLKSNDMYVFCYL